jgi:XTP/dITP diphosphohydrolase
VKQLLIATTNSGKVVEVRSGLSGLEGWRLKPVPASTASIEETGATFSENAAQKAIHFSMHGNELTLGDDSGLCVDALGGRPGVHSARYAESVDARIRKLLEELKDVPEKERTAFFVCALAVAQRGKLVWTVERRVYGRIAFVPSGANGFGYDPVFFLPDLGRTMADLSTEDKNRLSARGQALAELKIFLNSL